MLWILYACNLWTLACRYLIVKYQPRPFTYVSLKYLNEHIGMVMQVLMCGRSRAAGAGGKEVR